MEKHKLTAETETELQSALAELRAEASAAAAELESRHGAALRSLERCVQAALLDALKTFRERVAETTAQSRFCTRIATIASDYIEWMQWALGDLPAIALASRVSEDELSQRLGGCMLVYFAGRILDDYLDRHHLYRGRRNTLLAAVTEDHGAGGEAEAITVLVALLITMEGLSQLPADAGEASRAVIASLRRLVTGILLDRSGPEVWSESFYERLVELKNVDYWRILYAAVDAPGALPLYKFWSGYYRLGQELNDLQDYVRDEAQGRPNLVSILRNKLAAEGAELGPGISLRNGELLAAVGSHLGNRLLGLRQEALLHGELERTVTLTKLGQMLEAIGKQGVLEPPRAEVVELGARRMALAWHAAADEFLQRFGIDALEHTPCPVCGSNDAAPMFRKQGFQYNRCAGCTHIYVSPRVRDEIVQQMAAEEGSDQYDPFLEIQKIYAEHLCRVLREQGSGPRLLDVGHGSGYLMMMARAYGFQVYGVDSSARSVEAMKPVFGDRVTQLKLAATALPWGQFDQVVMNHVLEHLPEPSKALPQVEAALNDGALFYVAVPDSESLQFRLYGKHWEAVHPIAHPQFFCEASLSRLLRGAGLEPVVRLRSPALVGPEQQRWMRLFRRLDGDEAGELAMVARVVRGGDFSVVA